MLTFYPPDLQQKPSRWTGPCQGAPLKSFSSNLVWLAWKSIIATILIKHLWRCVHRNSFQPDLNANWFRNNWFLAFDDWWMAEFELLQLWRSEFLSPRMSINYEPVMWSTNNAIGIRTIVQLCGKLTNNSWHLRIVREEPNCRPQKLCIRIHQESLSISNSNVTWIPRRRQIVRLTIDIGYACWLRGLWMSVFGGCSPFWEKLA